MSSELLVPSAERSAATVAPPARQSFRERRKKLPGSLAAQGEPLVWLTGGALAIALVMIIGLLLLVLVQGVGTFWPVPVVQIKTTDGGVYLGEVTRSEAFVPNKAALAQLPADLSARANSMAAQNDGRLRRRLVRTGNFELSNTHFSWVDDFRVSKETEPKWAMVVERMSWGRFYGFPQAFLIDGKEVATSPDGVWEQYSKFHDPVQSRRRERISLQKHALGASGHRRNAARLDVVQAELDYGRESPQFAAAQQAFDEVNRVETETDAKTLDKIDGLSRENARYEMRMATADGQDKVLPLDEIVRAYPANQLGWFGRLGVYFSRWAEFLIDDPREANSEGGVFPAIFGTATMTLLMTLAVVPFGVLAALYMREYATAGPIVSVVRVAINNLAGVPSIVFGVFGLGFFCYALGGSIDQLLFPASVAENDPTFGTGGLLWAALTLALLTLPVVIVTTEEALAAVPGSMREGSYACGASKWQTIQRIVLPRAMPGIMTGAILAIARGAGEVAPLMLVGAMKLAPELPVDGIFPFVHPQRSFMHLGFGIYDLGFQSQNSEAAKPMVFTMTLLLILLIMFLNVVAIWMRARLRRRFVASHF